MKIVNLAYYTDSTYKKTDYIQVNPQHIISKVSMAFDVDSEDKPPHRICEIKLSDGTLIKRVWLWEEFIMDGFNTQNKDKDKEIKIY